MMMRTWQGGAVKKRKQCKRGCSLRGSYWNRAAGAVCSRMWQGCAGVLPLPPMKALCSYVSRQPGVTTGMDTYMHGTLGRVALASTGGHQQCSAMGKRKSKRRCGKSNGALLPKIPPKPSVVATKTEAGSPRQPGTSATIQVDRSSYPTPAAAGKAWRHAAPLQALARARPRGAIHNSALLNHTSARLIHPSGAMLRAHHASCPQGGTKPCTYDL